ncbi:MAG: isochorismate synthase [Lentisphaeria bacterium]|nr:isochorismate synthase [Lentisphaeria bacterium]
MSEDSQWDAFKKALNEKLDALRTHWKSEVTSDLSAYRIILPVQISNLTEWWVAQQSDAKAFLANRNAKMEMAALGIATEFICDSKAKLDSLYTEILPLLQKKDLDFRVYGGFAFDFDHEIVTEWKSFGLGHFFIPLFEVHDRHDEGQYFICNCIWNHELDLDFYIDFLKLSANKLFFNEKSLAKNNSKLLNESNTPNEIGWGSYFKEIQNFISMGESQKIVPAVCKEMVFDQKISPEYCFANLRLAAPDCYHFYFQFKQDTAFLGATPEMLFYRKGKQLLSEAIAGTRVRGETKEEDLELGNSLLKSRKDIGEHRFVTEYLTDHLQDVMEIMQVSEEPQLLKLSRLQHLQQQVTGLLKDQVTDEDLLNLLHPTPAVCGVPTLKAKKFIAEHEEFSRGWFAGPVGWFGVDGAGFGVGIRSALITDNKAYIYAGAGVVEDSDLEAEWNEIQNKMEGMRIVLKESTGN